MIDVLCKEKTSYIVQSVGKTKQLLPSTDYGDIKALILTNFTFS